ncbi:hypothetical protein O0I10_000322 [Lichtheimia ornata]|uniref:Uncharacterized protein n=1 Tax=Lichtheimia ornata TaxID=688661 RepID=A0AAD7Y549_9FUNG|nr:uncharacterized protein O0I10_000322 [Lichtheimia ornata]KAJ8664044.1 hypothetical protein O0I10_000322 [Lichtheimia ornata]
MSDSLDMSTASLVSQPARSLSDSTPDVMQASSLSSSIPSMPSPPSPRSLVLTESESRQHPTDIPYPEVNDSNNSVASSSSSSSSSAVAPKQSTGASIWNMIRAALGKVAYYIFKDNNLPLLVNLIYHLAAARSLMLRPNRTIDRYIQVPVSMQREKKHVVAATTLATDSLRMVGVMHLALGLLAGLALKERRIAAERSALLVLTLASAGQAWAHARGYWESSRYYTLRAIQEIGSLDTGVLFITAVALSKTARRSGHWI